MPDAAGRPSAVSAKPAMGSARERDELVRQRSSSRAGYSRMLVLVDQRRASVAVDGDDDGQPDGRLGGGHGHHEQGDDRRVAPASAGVNAPKATIARLTALSISSMDISMAIALRRARKPNVPMRTAGQTGPGRRRASGSRLAARLALGKEDRRR